MNFNTLDEAVRLVKEKKNVNFRLLNYSMYQEPEMLSFGNQSIALHREPEIKLTMEVYVDHISWLETVELEYVIFGSDLLDGSCVDKVIGGDINKYTQDKKEILRMAFILYNGIKYGVYREQRKDYIDKGWHPRVVRMNTKF